MAKLMPGDKVTFLYEHEHYWRASHRGRVVSRAKNGAFVFMGQVGADGSHRQFRLADEGITWVRGWHSNRDPSTLDALFAAFTLTRSR